MDVQPVQDEPLSMRIEQRVKHVRMVRFQIRIRQHVCLVRMDKFQMFQVQSVLNVHPTK